MNWLELVPLFLRIVSTIMSAAKSAQDRGIGRTQAIAEALTAANADLLAANQAKAEAELRHANDPTDGAFDDEFRRKD